MKSIILTSLLALSLGAFGCGALPVLQSNGSGSPTRTVCRGFGAQRAVAYALPQLSTAIGAWINQLDAGDVQRGLQLRQAAQIQVYADNQIQASTFPTGGAPTIYISTALQRRASNTQLEWFIGHEIGHHVVGQRGGHTSEAQCDLFGIALVAAQGIPNAAQVGAGAIAMTGNHPDSGTHPATGDRVAVMQRYGQQAVAAGARAAGGGFVPSPTTDQPRTVPAYAPPRPAYQEPQAPIAEDGNPIAQQPSRAPILPRQGTGKNGFLPDDFTPHDKTFGVARRRRDIRCEQGITVAGQPCPQQ